MSAGERSGAGGRHRELDPRATEQASSPWWETTGSPDKRTTFFNNLLRLRRRRRRKLSDPWANTPTEPPQEVQPNEFPFR